MFTSAIYFCVKLGLLQLYPAYICYKAIKTNNQQEFGSLLIFWVVSITYLSLEYFSDIFLFWLPFYNEIKLVLVLWLILPQTQGASVFYTRYLDPFLNTHEAQIDNALVEIQAKLKQTIVLYGKQAIVNVRKWVIDTVFKGQGAAVEEKDISSSSTTTTAPTEPAVMSETGGYIISPYNLFSTLVASTTNRFQPSPDIPQPPAMDQLNTPIFTDTPIQLAQSSPTGEKLKRSDSHDSFVDIRDGTSNATTATTTTPPPPPLQETATSWGGYLSSWIKKPSSSSTSIPTVDHAKQD